MKKIIIVAVFAIVAVFSLKAQSEKIFVLGKVVDSDSLRAIPFGYVGSSLSGLGYATGEDGLFRLEMSVKDTLVFRSMGYEMEKWIVADYDLNRDTVMFVARNRSYELDEVNVRWFKSYASFRSMVANMDMIPTGGTMKLSINFEKLMAEAKAQGGQVGVSIAINMDIKSEAEKRYERLLAHESLYAQFNRLTNRENLNQLTGLKEAALDSFIVYLRSRKTIDPNLPEYDMLAAINLVYEEFMALKTDTIAN